MRARDRIRLKQAERQAEGYLELGMAKHALDMLDCLEDAAHWSPHALYLRGERKTDPGVPEDAYLRVERPSGPFAVKIALAPSVDRKHVRAVYRDGVLEVVLPKRQAESTSPVEIATAEP